ncbi:MAG: hypothetical protein OXF02_00955 [Simkaniaceae bacterium]|nr:hypothetical protein [Simkaniaceae bacterium]
MNRSLFDRTYAFALRHRNEETGFLHIGDTIPVYENLCFALTLLRTRTVRNMTQGAELLRRLIAFFTDGFPLYLHEFSDNGPDIRQLRALLPLYWQLKLFRNVLSAPCVRRLEAIRAFLSDKGRECVYPFLVAMRGEEIPEYVPRNDHDRGELLLAYSVMEEKRVWPLRVALAGWDGRMMIGKEAGYQRETEPECTLFDLFMASYQGCVAGRFDRDSPAYFEGSLVFPFPETPLPVKGGTAPVVALNGSSPHADFHSFSFRSGSRARIYSFVCQDRVYVRKEGGRFLFFLGESGKEELTFFTERGEGSACFVSGVRETVFYPEEPVEVRTEGHRFGFSLSLVKGEGRFVGRVGFGNRPAQRGGDEGGNPEHRASYDWRITVEALLLSSDAVIALTLTG